MNEISLTAYTDAAAFNNGRKIPSLPEHSASAGVILFDDIIIVSTSRFNPNSTISFGELTAIRILLKKVYELAKESNNFINLELYSDSAYSVQAINIWMKDWKKRSNGKYWFNSSGARVAHQDILEDIDSLMSNDFMKVTLRHISGHIDCSKKKHITKAKERFRRFNLQDVTLEELLIHTKYNDLCDAYAKCVLKESMGI